MPAFRDLDGLGAWGSGGLAHFGTWMGPAREVLGGFGGDNTLRANADLGLCREISRINP